MSPETDQLPIEERLGNAVAEARLELATLKRKLALLLHSVGDEGTCRGCKKDIYWLLHRNGKRTPYDVDGTNHFATCPDRELFKGERKK